LIESLGEVEVAGDYLYVRGKFSRAATANHRADFRVGGQLGDNLAADSAGCSNDEDTVHEGLR
jgi:hypothetical protein